MKRLYPTQLRVVSKATDLIESEESKKGYFDPSAKGCLQIGVDCDRRCLYISSPGNWYKSYTFRLKRSTKTLTVAASAEEKDGNGGDDCDTAVNYGEEHVIRGDDCDLWRIAALLIRDQMGRKAIHNSDCRFLTVSNISSTMAKQFYYLTKHVLTRLGVDYTISSSLFSPPFYSASMPDVREKPKRRRGKGKREVQNASLWEQV